MNYELTEDGTECFAESMLMDKVKMFKTYRVETLWSNTGDTRDQKVSIIRGSTKIESEENGAEKDPLYNLGDRTSV